MNAARRCIARRYFATMCAASVPIFGERISTRSPGFEKKFRRHLAVGRTRARIGGRALGRSAGDHVARMKGKVR